MGALVAPVSGWDDPWKVSDSEHHGPGKGSSDDAVTTPKHDPLADLAARTAVGERRATDQLLRALSPRVLGVARRILGSTHPDVEDASQEALVAIVKALATFRGDSSVQHYATRIAVRTCLHVRKRGHTHQKRLRLVEDGQLMRTPARDVAVVARQRDLLMTAMSDIPAEQAETLLMRVVLGLSLKEVATATGVPVNTVRSRVRLAKEALRRRIEQSSRRRDLGGTS